jgi:hypothetical protein
MADEDETTNDNKDEETTEVVVPEAKELEDEIEHGGAITLQHLQDLETRLKREVASTRKDDQADADEKAQLQAELTRLKEAIADLTKKLEGKGEEHDDSTVVVPPAEFDPPVNSNNEQGSGGTEDTTPANEGPKKKKWREYF